MHNHRTMVVADRAWSHTFFCKKTTNIINIVQGDLLEDRNKLPAMVFDRLPLVCDVDIIRNQNYDNRRNLNIAKIINQKVDNKRNHNYNNIRN